MPRLFTAFPLPPEIRLALAASRPAPASGVRLVAPDQMHVTLHFIGEAEVGYVAELLEGVAMTRCELALAGVGQFGRGSVLWAGVQRHPALLQLHAAIGAALAAGGIAVERRAYRPHVTLARCKPHVPHAYLSDFLQRHAALQLPPLLATRFALYSSTPTASGPLYRIERWFPSSEEAAVTKRPA